MKCPQCGKWNQSNLPHCIYCAQPLSNDSKAENNTPTWQSELRDGTKPKAYIRIAEDGVEDINIDPREQLAHEMANLKSRKNSGARVHEQLRQRSNEQHFSTKHSVRTTSNQSTFFNPLSENQRNGQETQTHENGNLKSSEQSTPQENEAHYHNIYSDSHYEYGSSKRFSVSEDENIYDGYHDSSVYYPHYSDHRAFENSVRMNTLRKSKKESSFSLKKFFVVILVLILLVGGGWCAYTFFLQDFFNESQENELDISIIPGIREDLAAHTIMIPGVEGQRITLRELRTSAIVVGGFATFDIMDHIWYDNLTDVLDENMTVTLTPYAVSDTGKQEALPKISYTIDIPLSPIDLGKPDKPYQVVSTSLYNIVFYVREGSKVYVNGDDYSDMVNTEDGKVSFNVTVQPIGENIFTIEVHSQYCRKNEIQLTLYREKQEIPLDLASDIASSSSHESRTMLVEATTLPGAVVKVLSPYTDLNITNVDVDGSFSFRAKFDKIGNNSIVITADYPGKNTTRVEHIVNYVPNIDIYSRKAWDIKTQYTDLMDNIDLRKKNSQIYVMMGTISSIETTKPQRAYINVGTEENPIEVYIENSSRTQWEEGKYYRLYGDAFGMYNNMPWLVVRYTYDH